MSKYISCTLPLDCNKWITFTNYVIVNGQLTLTVCIKTAGPSRPEGALPDWIGIGYYGYFFRFLLKMPKPKWISFVGYP